MASTAILFFIMGLLHLHYCYQGIQDFEEEATKLINQIRTVHRAPPVKPGESMMGNAQACAKMIWAKHNNDPEHGCPEGNVRESIYKTDKGAKDKMALVREAINHWKEGCKDFDESVKTELTGGTFNAWNFAYMVWKGADGFGIGVYDEYKDAYVVATYHVRFSRGGIKKNVFKGNC